MRLMLGAPSDPGKRPDANSRVPTAIVAPANAGQQPTLSLV
jgi:hypothetical protein